MPRKRPEQRRNRAHTRNFRTRGKSAVAVDYSNVESVSRSISRSGVKPARLKSSTPKPKRIPRKKKVLGKSGRSVAKSKRKKMKLGDTPLIKSIDFSTQKKSKIRMMSIKNSKVSSRKKVKKNPKELIKSEVIILNKSEHKFATKPARTTAKSRSKTSGKKTPRPKKSTVFDLKKKRKRSQKPTLKKRTGVSKYLKSRTDRPTPRRMRTPSSTKRKIK